MPKLVLKSTLETVTYSSVDYDLLGNERSIPEISGYGNIIDVNIEVEGRDICTILIGNTKFTKDQISGLIHLASAHEEANKKLLESFLKGTIPCTQLQVVDVSYQDTVVVATLPAIAVKEAP